MIGISHIPQCYGNSVAMPTRVIPQLPLCLSRIEFMFVMKVSWNSRHTFFAMAT